MKSKQYEITSFKISCLGALTISAWGFLMAYHTSSDIVMLDACYNLLSAALAFFSLTIIHMISQGETKTFPLGFYSFESLSVLIRGFSLLFITLMAIHGSVRTLLAGGREPDLGLMTIYVFIALAAIIVVWLIIRNYSKKTNSDMLKAEELAWFINSLITGAIGAAFLITFLFRMTSLHWVERYVDQVLVICLGVFLIKDPFVIIRNGLKELLLAAPADDYVTPIRERVLDLAEDYKLKGVLVEAIKTGRKFWITIRADPGIESVTTDDVENFRKEAIIRIKELYDTVDLEIIIQKIPRNR